MCTVNLPLGDRKALGINKVGKLLPGAVMEFTTAWTLHSDATLPCGIGSTFAEIELLRSHYDGSFLAACSPLSGTAEIPEEVIEVFPNPSTGNVRIRYGDLPVQGIRLFSPDGSLLQVIRDVPASQTNLELAEPAGGIYTVQLLTERGIAVKKIAVLR